MDDSNGMVEGLSATLDFVGPDCIEIPNLVVVYLRTAEKVAALIPTPSFTDDLALRRRAVSRFVWTLDAAPREALKAALIAAEVEVSGWWEAPEVEMPAQQAAGG